MDHQCPDMNGLKQLKHQGNLTLRNPNYHVHLEKTEEFEGGQGVLVYTVFCYQTSPTTGFDRYYRTLSEDVQQGNLPEPLIDLSNYKLDNGDSSGRRLVTNGKMRFLFPARSSSRWLTLRSKHI